MKMLRREHRLRHAELRAKALAESLVGRRLPLAGPRAGGARPCS
jgi:hypothetical protein